MRSRVVLFWIALVGLSVSPWSLGAADAPAEDAAGRLPIDPWWDRWARDADGDGLDDRFLELERLGAAAARTASGTPRFAVHETPAGLVYDVFVRYDRAPTPADVARVEALSDRPVRGYGWAEVVYVPGVPLHVVRALAGLTGVKGVELERGVVPTMDQAAPALLVNDSATFGQGAWRRWKVLGDGIGVAFLDTGIDQEHEAFDPTRFLGGYDATIPFGALDTGPLPRLVTPLNERDPDDETARTHGTHVASIVTSNDPNRTYFGVSPLASYLDVKVIMSTPLGDFGTSQTPYGVGSMVIEGLDFVRRYNAGESHLGAPKVPVRIVSMSVAEMEPDENGSSVLSHAVNRMVDEGVSVVAAAGNCGPTGGSECCANGPLPDDCTDRRGNDTIPAPAAAKRAIAVGALDGAGTVGWDDDNVPGFSSRGPNGGEEKPDLVAYGVNIVGAKGRPDGGQGGNEYHALSGTSMAAPFVSGIVALMYDANDALAPEEVKAILSATARDWGDEGWDPVHGHGVPNAYFAIGVALGLLDPETTQIDERGHDVPVVTGPVPEDRPEPTPTKEPVQNAQPVAAFTFGPKTPFAGQPVVFADRSTDPENDKLVAHNWDFGDGITDKGTRVAHVYDRPGTYEVRLSVTDKGGLAGSTSTKVVVSPAPGVDSEESPMLGPLVVVAASVFLLALARRP